jgi:hypothetical protein
MKYWLQDHITRLLIDMIKKINPCKDESLADLLHETAGRYQKRPKEGWSCPDDWPED